MLPLLRRPGAAAAATHAFTTWCFPIIETASPEVFTFNIEIKTAATFV